MDTIWTVYLLGGLSLQHARADPVPLRLNKPNLVLARIAFSPGEQVGRDELIEMLWPDALGDRERHSLSAALDTLRHMLEPSGVVRRSVLLADRASVWLSPDSVTTDLSQLQREIGSAHRGGADYFNRMQRAVGMYHGDLLPRVDLDWVVTQRESLAAWFSGELRSLITRLQAAGRLDEALDYALGAVARWPDDEDLHEVVLRLLIALGREEEAMRRFTALCTRLLSTQRRGPTPSIGRLMAPYKDRLNLALSASRASANTGPNVHPGRRTDAGVVPGSGGLPIYLSRFFGREEELSVLEAALGSPKCDTAELFAPDRARLVTVTGLGGCGKTRLAVEAAERLAGAFEGHVLFVQLASAAQCQDLVSAVARALKGPASGPAGIEQITGKLKNGPWLLVLDSCERATARVRAVRTLLQACTTLRILATSRVPLRVAGERLLSLGPLPVPGRPCTAQSLCEFPSAQMFVERAQAANAGFRVTDDDAAALSAVLGRLEGLPLAIEIVAARSVALSPAQLLEELARDSELALGPTDPGHRSLTHVIDWSVRHLPTRDRRFLLELSAFRGGLTLDAARTLAGVQNAGDFISHLANHALVGITSRGHGNRYTMLDSLREHAAGRLNRHERDVLASRHAAYYLHLLIETGPQLRTLDQRGALATLDDEQANIMAAIEHCRGGADEIRLAAAAWRYWYFRSQPGIAADILKRALSVDRLDLPEYAEALHGYGVFLELQDDVPGAEAALRASLALTAGRVDRALAHGRTLNSLALLQDKAADRASALQSSLAALDTLRRAGDPLDVAGCLNTVARVHWHLADNPAAEACFIEALGLFERLEDWPSVAIIRFNVGCLAAERGDLARARAAFERGLAHFRELGNRAWIAAALHNLGDTILQQGDRSTARPHLVEALTIRHELGDHSGAAATTDALAAVAFSSGDVTYAVRLAAGAAALRGRHSLPVSAGKRVSYDAVIQRYREAASELDFEAPWLFGSELDFDTLVLYATEQRVTPRPS